MKNSQFYLSLALTGLTLLCLNNAHGEGGVGSSGGGYGLVSKDGTVFFADMVSKYEIDPSQLATAEEVSALFFDKNRFVKQIAEDARGFFDCAIDKINATDIPYKAYWTSLLRQSRVLKVEFPLGKSAPGVQFVQQGFPYYADASARFDAKVQFPLGAYDKGVLWIQKRLVEHLVNADHSCGFAVHEAIRVLNYGLALQHPFTTAEIEKLTPAIMKNDGAKYASLKDLKQPGEFTQYINAIQAIIDLDKTPGLPVEGRGAKLLQIAKASAMALREKAAIAMTNPSADSFSALAPETVQTSRKLRDYYFEFYSKKFTSEQQSMVSDLYFDLVNSAEDLDAASVQQVSSETWITIYKNLTNSLRTPTAPLKAGEYLDVKTLEIVNKDGSI